jgi:Fur family transcriptional regulator, ferric uptake regulator
LDTAQILDIHVELPQDLIAQIEQQTGVRIVDYRIDFYGYRSPESATEGSIASDRPPAA